MIQIQSVLPRIVSVTCVVIRVRSVAVQMGSVIQAFVTIVSIIVWRRLQIKFQRASLQRLLPVQGVFGKMAASQLVKFYPQMGSSSIVPHQDG